MGDNFKKFAERYRQFLVLRNRSYEIDKYPQMVAANANSFFKKVQGRIDEDDYSDLFDEFAIEYSGAELKDWNELIDRKIRFRKLSQIKNYLPPPSTGPPASTEYWAACMKYIRMVTGVDINRQQIHREKGDFEKVGNGQYIDLDEFMLKELPPGHPSRRLHENK